MTLKHFICRQVPGKILQVGDSILGVTRHNGRMGTIAWDDALT